MKRFKSHRLEEIVNSQEQGLKPALLNFMANTSNNRTIDYTHSIDISFEERRNEIIMNLAKIRKARHFNQRDYNRLIKTLNRISSTNFIEYDLKAFMKKVNKRIDFDAFYLIPDTNHVHMLLVVYKGNIKHFNRKAKKRPYCWDVKVNEFNSDIGEYLENKVKYLMTRRNMNIKEYENIVYDFYPDRERIDSFFDEYQTVYEFKLDNLGKGLREKLSKYIKTQMLNEVLQ